MGFHKLRKKVGRDIKRLRWEESPLSTLSSILPFLPLCFLPSFFPLLLASFLKYSQVITYIFGTALDTENISRSRTHSFSAPMEL